VPTAEARGGGRLTPLFADLLAGARKRGAVISTLFPTAPAIYRTFGYEIVGHFDSVDLPTSTLAAVRAPTTSLRTRRASAADVDAVRRVYDAWAAAQNGPLTRRGVSFGTAGEDLLADHTGVTVAVDEAEVVRGYAAWRRGRGYGESSRLAVTDLTATDPDATRALLRTLGTFAPVTTTTRLDTSGEDPVRFVLPTAHWQVVDSEPYMLRVLDVPGAFEARHYPGHVTADLTFRVHDGTVPEVDGTWRLRVADGRASCTPGSAPGIELGSRGLALLYAGAQGTANLRMAGLLDGQDGDDDVWDSLLGGRQVHIRDYF
jgi:predicted acetyltransferase